MRPVRQLQHLQLYHFTPCPYCLLVHVALWWLRLELPMKNILFSADYSRELESGGGKLQVPCLRIENDIGPVHWLYESVDIIRYLRTV